MEEDDFYEDLLRKNLTTGYIKRIEEAVPLDKLIKIRTTYLMNCLSNFARTDASAGANAELSNRNLSGEIHSDENKIMKAKMGPENNRESDEESENDNDGLDFDSDRSSLHAEAKIEMLSDSEPDESINENLNEGESSSKRLCKSKPASNKEIPPESKIEIEELTTDLIQTDQNEQLGLCAQILHNLVSNAEIMQHIFNYLPPVDLLRFRTVSTDWDSQIISHLNKNNILQHLSFEKRNIKEFISLMKSSKIIPFTKFDLTNQGKKNHSSIQRLYQICGPFVTHLTVDIQYFMQKLRQFQPNLESLHLVGKAMSQDDDDCSITESDDDTSASTSDDNDSSADERDDNQNDFSANKSQSFVFAKLKSITFTFDDNLFLVCEYTTLFNVMPNLNKLEVRLNGPADFLSESSIESDIFKALTKTGGLKKITKIHVDTLSKPTLNTLCYPMSVQLEEFCVDRIDEKIDLGLLYNLLVHQGQSLKKLEIRTTFNRSKSSTKSAPCLQKNPNNSFHYLRLKNMEALTCLTIHVVNDAFFPITYSSLKNLPNLVRVKIPNIFSDMAEELSVEFSHPKVTDLSLNLNRSEVEIQRKKAFCSQNVITTLGVIFPSVKSLKLSYPIHEEIQTVAEVWSELKHLKLDLKRAHYKERCIEDITSLEDLQTFFPSLWKLKDLETLSISEFDLKSNTVEHRFFAHFEKMNEN